VALRIQIGRSVPQQDLENADSVSGNSSVQWGAAGVVGEVGLGSRVEESLSCVGTGVTRRKME